MLTKEYGYPHSVINRGWPGDLATQGLAKLDGILKEFPTAKSWLIAFGTNDSNHNINASSFKATIQKIVDRIHTAIPGSKVYLPKVFYWPKDLVSQYHDKMGDIIRNTPNTFWGADLDTIFRGNHDLYYHREYNTQEGTWFSTPNTHHPNGIGVQKMALLWKLALADRAILVADGNEHSMGSTWADKVQVDNLHTIGLNEDNLFMICERPYTVGTAPEGCKFAVPWWSWEAKLTGDTDFNGGSLKVTIREERDTLTVSGASSWNQIWLALGGTLLPTGRVVNPRNSRNENLSATIDAPGQVAVVIKR
jgi:lysophospholipase L1-like esterase